MFRSMPFILLLLILIVSTLGSLIPLWLKQYLYTASFCIKTIIIFLLPLIIFCLLFKVVISLSSKATKIIGIILALVCCSNFITTFFSHYIGSWVYNFDLSIIIPKDDNVGLKPLWNFELPQIIPNNIAMFSAIIIGILAAKFYQIKANKIADSLNYYLEYVFKLLVYLIPFFIIGFIIKLQYDGVIITILKDYAAIFCIVVITQLLYISLMYCLLNKCNVKSFLISLKNMIPAALVGFSTMSSAASMPLTIIGVAKNADNKDLASSVVPATVSIHLVGDCIAIPIFAYAVLKSFGIAEPSLFSYLIFASYFVIAKFSVAAIPGGGIIVMLPILEKYLGFNSDMMSIITALYILFDPVITSTNILGNGAFAKLAEKTIYFLDHNNKEVHK